MPPKKKKGKKKGSAKKSARKSATRKEKVETEQPLTELSKEFYLIQIRDLETRVGRYQRKCDQLEIRNEDLRKEAEEETKKLTDERQNYSEELKRVQQEIEDAREKFLALEEERIAEKDQFQLNIQALRAANQGEKDQLLSEVTLLQGRLNAVDKYISEKEEKEAKLLELEREIEAKTKEHQETLNALERKALQDKNRLKKEMEARLNDVAAEFRRVSNRQMAATTKRTITENVTMSSQLTKVSEQTEKLIRENDQLKKAEKILMRKLQVAEFNETEFSRKYVGSQNTLREITKKFNEQDELLYAYMDREANHEKLEASFVEAREQLEAAELERDNLQSQLRERDAELKELYTKMAAVCEDNEKLTTILSQCASAIQDFLKVPLESTGDTLPTARDPLLRDSFLSSLFTLLNSAASFNLTPGPASFNPNMPTKLRPMAGDSFGGYHYLPGDLGFVPKPVSATSQLGHLRRVKTRSIATQCGPKSRMVTTEQLISSKGALTGPLPVSLVSPARNV